MITSKVQHTGFFTVFLLFTYLQTEYDDQEDSIGCQQDSGLLDGSAVAQEGDDEDESSEGDEDVSCLVNDGGLDKLLEYCKLLAVKY